MAKLIITENGRDKIYEIVDDEFSIGSGAQAGLKLRSEKVSPLHVTIRKGREGFRLVDLESKAGTKVNGRAVNEHVLSNGDTIELGDVKIAYIGASGAAVAKSRPAAASKGGRKGVKLDAPRPHERKRGNQRSSGANAAIIGAGVLGLILVVWFMLNSTGSPGDEIKFELVNQRDELVRNGSLAVADAERTAQKWRIKFSSLTSDQRQALEALEEQLSLVQRVDKDAAAESAAKPLWVKIANKNKRNSSDSEGIVKLCEQYLRDFPKASKADEVKKILTRYQAMGEMTAEQKELARVEGIVSDALTAPKVKVLEANPEKGWKAWRISSGDLRAALKAVDTMDPRVAAMYPEKVQGLRRRLRLKARQWLSPRKNEVKYYLRQGSVDETRARTLCEEWVIKKLPHEVIRDYLSSPDGGYENPLNRDAEFAVQKLLKEYLAKYKD